MESPRTISHTNSSPIAEAAIAITASDAQSSNADQPAVVETVVTSEPAPLRTTTNGEAGLAPAHVESTPKPADAVQPEAAAAAAGAEPPADGFSAYVQQAIKDIAAREGFTGAFETRSEFGVNRGDGFIGDITRVTLSGAQTRNGVTYADAELTLIVKLAPAHPIRRQFALALFEREAFVYNEMLPHFVQFQLEHGLRPGQAGFHAFPRCYHAHFDRATGEAVIILENLLDGGFRMESKLKSVKYEFARTVLERLADLHGISLAMRQQQPERFERYKELADVMASDDKKTIAMNRVMLSASAAKAVTALEDGETALREKVLNASAAIVDETDRYKGGNCEPYAVVIHGDCWVNNMMFKHASGQSLQVCFYDWQCTRFASPILDIVYFLFLCTDAPLRARYYDDLIQGYHHALRAQLDRLGADVNELFPLTAMLRQLKAYGRYALAAVIIILPMLCTEKKDVPPIEDMMEKIENETFDGQFFTVPDGAQSEFKSRMSGILRDMNSKGYF